MDQIRIVDLEVAYCIGVTEEERRAPQRLQISVTMEADLLPASRSDDLKDTIDYHAICQRLIGFGEGRSWRLLESLADEIARVLVQELGSRQVQVEVKKFIIPEARYVSVVRTRVAS